MVRNSEGNLVDNNGVAVFKNPIFNQLTSREHLSQISPNALYVDTQYNQVFATNVEDTRTFLDYNCSKLIDDNASLASDENIKKQYLNDVICFAAITKKVLKTADQDTKNKILGGVFATKADSSEDSMIPMYLCVELLQAKCLKEKDMPLENLEVFDISPNAEVTKDSTLWNQLQSVIDDLKTLDFDKKDYFGDMSDDSRNYLAACQIDPNGSVDIFAKCEEDKCMLYVTQGETSNSIAMFNVTKENTENNVAQTPVENVASPVQAAAPEVQQPQAPVTTDAPAAELPTLNTAPDSNKGNELPPTENSGDVMSGDSIPAINTDVVNNVDVSFANNDLLKKINPRIQVAAANYQEKKNSASAKYEEILRLLEEYKVLYEAEKEASNEILSIVNEAMMQNNTGEAVQEETNVKKAA